MAKHLILAYKQTHERKITSNFGVQISKIKANFEKKNLQSITRF